MSAVLGYQQVYIRSKRSVIVSTRMQVVLVLALISVLGIKVWSQAMITDLGYRIGQARIRARDLEGTMRELSLARSVLMRPSTLQAEAKSRLGLGQLAPNQALKISRSKSTVRNGSVEASL